MAVLINFTVFNSQKTFGIFGCHTKEGCNLHPEQSARTAGCDSGCNADDVAGTDGSGQRRTESTKRSNLAMAVVFILEHKTKCFA